MRRGKERKGKGIGRIVTLALESRGSTKRSHSLPYSSHNQSISIQTEKGPVGLKNIYIYIQEARIKLIENEDYAENWS